MTVTIGLTVSPQHGEMSDMRNCWMTAEELGVDALYTADHFTAMLVDQASWNIYSRLDVTHKITMILLTAKCQ